MVILFVFAFIGCNSEQNKNDTTVTGTYVTTYQTEYSKARDTLEITTLNNKGHTYHYTRRTGFRKISNGVLGPYQYKTENSSCVYDKATAQINEQRHGRIYSFSSDGNSLVSGNSVYRRIR